ncbi:plasma protease C1 inhibitor [Ambystoma mexicanum]|uniref:plasma protease C1 inhibitor n=1 Tax=Ambystoma mexicanum TaxID=8296 RepID=UPI0037E90430
MWVTYLVLVTFSYQTVAHENVTESVIANLNVESVSKCPLPLRDVKIIHLAKSPKDVTHQELENESGLSVAGHQPRPEGIVPTESESKAETLSRNHERDQDGIWGEREELEKDRQMPTGNGDSQQNPKQTQSDSYQQGTMDDHNLRQNMGSYEEPVNESGLPVAGHQPRPEGIVPTESESKAETLSRNNERDQDGIWGEREEIEKDQQMHTGHCDSQQNQSDGYQQATMDDNNPGQNLGSNETMNPSYNGDSFQIKQEPAGNLNETGEEGTTQTESPLQTTPEPTPTTTTTEDPNWCRKHGFVKPWPLCREEAVVNGTQKLAEGLTMFSLKLFRQILEKDQKANVVVSPLSVAMVLSHLLLGARDDTKDLLLDTLFGPENANFSDCIHRTLQEMVASQGFESASGMFFRKDLHVNQFFLDQSEEFYKMKPQQFTESASENLEMVNNWVATYTNRRIKKILDEVPGNVKLVLLNAIFFQGKWKTKFEEKYTKKQSFNGISKKVYMMTSQKYPLVSVYDVILKARIGRFPLSDDMSMLIFVPQIPHRPLSETEAQLSPEVFQAIINRLDNAHVNPNMVSLPRFKVDSTQDLESIFNKLGLSQLFVGANLCGISAWDDLMLSGGRHRAVLQMDESGVVAAAASAISLARTVHVFDVRQPFLFVVWSETARIPMIMGRITDPSA